MVLVLLFVSLLFLESMSDPIAFTQVSKILSWWPQSSIAKSMGIPPYSNTSYNYVSLQSWTCSSGFGSVAAIYSKPLSTFGSNFLGTTDSQIRTELKKRYQEGGIKVLVGTFGDVEYPVRFGQNAFSCAQKLADDVMKNDLDGVEVNYQDTFTFTQGTAQVWLIDFTRKLRQLLPYHKIVHTVDSAYFRALSYPKQGYIKINREVGSLIDFYNVKYFGSSIQTYQTYESLFLKSLDPMTGTSVKELGQMGVSLDKIIVGKTAKVGFQGYIVGQLLDRWAKRANDQLGWSKGFWMGDLADDLNGDMINGVLVQLRNSSNDKNNTNGPNNNNITSTINVNNNVSNNSNTIMDNSTIAVTNKTVNNIAITTPITVPYPVYFVYVDSVTAWWGPQFLAGLGVPGYAPNMPYNVLALSFWLSTGPADLALAWANAGTYFSWISTDTQEVQKMFRKAYNDAGKKVIVSAFGSTQFPTSHGKDPIQTANKLADFVLTNNLDGCDIDWQDNAAMQQGTGQQWLITFHTQLRSRLPYHIISHAPQAPYFKSQAYKNGAYQTVHNKVGNTIDFYNVQFYNQGDTAYDTYDKLFVESGGWFSGTSVSEIIGRGMPARKIIVGKPATPKDVMNSGYVTPEELGSWWARFRKEKGIEPQVMYWQLVNDRQGLVVSTMLVRALEATNNITNTTNTTNIPTNNTTTNTTNSTTNNTNTTTTNTTNTTITNPTNTSFGGCNCPVPYPIYFAYADGLQSWWGSSMLAGMGVPGYSAETPYNYFALSFWMSSGTADLALIWERANLYMSFVGSDTGEIQKKIKKLYNDKGIKLMVSAFGSTEFPTTAGRDPKQTANKLAAFVLNNNLDGVDIDYEDNAAMQAGTGQPWLISFQTQLRSLLPNHIISHAPQAPYFKSQYYKNGGYVTVHTKVGHLIDFYNVQFYNQGNTQYNTYTELFTKATGTFSGTSLKQIVGRGVPARKLVLGKPATKADVMNTGFVEAENLGLMIRQFVKENESWRPSVMFWQFKNDHKGDVIRTVLEKAGVDFRLFEDLYKAKDGLVVNNNTNTVVNVNTTKNTANTTNANTNTTNTNTTNTTNTTKNSTNTNTTNTTNTTNPTNTSGFPIAANSSHTLSMFYCGFGSDFCGQSSTDDVSPKASVVILAFANTQANGSIVVDSANYPSSLVSSWKFNGKKVLLSVGGQNGHWESVFSNSYNTLNFVNSVADALNKYNLDGIDIDIQYYSATPRTVANMLIQLKTKISPKLLVVSPQCVGVYQGTAVPSPDVGGQAWNYFVPIIKLADAYIDYYQVQAYNNWYGGLTGGSLAYLKEVYLHWRNLLGTIAWINKIPDFSGVDGNKLVMGVLASTSAGNSAYQASPQTIKEFKTWIKANNYPLKGFMMWDSNWDKLNAFTVSDAVTDMNY